MQTTSLPSSNLPSTRGAATDSSASNNAHAAERFTEAMHRALSGVDARAHQQSNPNFSPTEETAPKNRSHDSDKIAVDKKLNKAKRNSENANSQFLGTAGAATLPQHSPVQATGNGDDSDAPNGGVTPILDGTSNPETAVALTPDNAETPAQTASSPANPATDTKISPEKSGHPPFPNTAATPDLAASSSEPDSAPADAAESAALIEAISSNAPIPEAKPPVAQAGASPADIRGTSAAKQDITMKKAEKTPKVAGPAEQDLPGIAVSGGEELPKGQKLSVKDDGKGSEKLETAAVEVPMRVLTSDDSSTPTVTAAASTSSTPLDARIMERTHDIVALHAMRVGEYTSDSLHVVVKPGAGIQLSLELRQSARGIEVQASLHKGDFAQLNQHWPDLQQRLEARGVRMAALTTSENFSSTSNQQFQQSKQQSPNQDPLYAGAFAEFALAGSMTEAPATRAARATAYRGWETWA